MVCDKTCIFFFFPIINKKFLMAKRSLLSRCPSYEDRDTHSPIRLLGEYFFMKHAIKHPNYNLIDARLDSFTNWPHWSPSPKSLSEVGFFFTGKYKTIFSLFQFFKKFLFSLIPDNFDISGRGDETIFFCCGIGIQEWLHSDNAWKERARCSPFCVFVRYIKGHTFVHEIRR